MVIPVALLYGSSFWTNSSYSDKVLECEGNSGEFVELVPQQLNYLGPKDLTQYFIRSNHCHTWKSSLRFGDNFAKDCLLTLVKSRLALGSPGWLIVSFIVCHLAENGLIHWKMVVGWLSRRNQNRNEEWLAKPVFCIVDTESCSSDQLVTALKGS